MRSARWEIGALLVGALSFGFLPLLGNQKAGNESAASEIDVDDLIQECQRSVRGKRRAGLVWWIPPEFWEASSESNAADTKALVDALRKYTMVAVAYGKVGPIGTIDWVPAAEIRTKTFLRNASGEEFSPLESVSTEAQILQGVLRPVLAGAIGKLGENLEILYFPAEDQKGVPLADPRGQRSFSVVLRLPEGEGESVFEWRLPLTSLVPPRFCPVGKERLKADWDYCPWHGSRL